MKINSLLILLILLCSLVIGCATGKASWKQETVTSYESTSIVLTGIYNTAKPMCDAGQISKENCEKIKSLYTKTRSAIITAGDALKIAINSEDIFTQNASMELFQRSLMDVAKFMPELMRLANNLGIVKKEVANAEN